MVLQFIFVCVNFYFKVFDTSLCGILEVKVVPYQCLGATLALHLGKVFINKVNINSRFLA